jgi:hypothetical protein
MPLFSRLTALCTIIETNAGLPVQIGRPETAGGLYVWPWRLEEDSRVHSTPLPRLQGDTPAAPAIHFLVLSSTSLTAEIFQALEGARAALLETPVFEAGNGRVRIAPDTLTASELTDLFTAADIPMRLCLAYTLRTSS